MTMKTRITASTSVSTTPRIDSFTKEVESTGKATFTSGGRSAESSATRAFTAVTVVSALAPGASLITKPAAGWPLKRLMTL